MQYWWSVQSYHWQGSRKACSLVSFKPIYQQSDVTMKIQDFIVESKVMKIKKSRIAHIWYSSTADSKINQPKLTNSSNKLTNYLFVFQSRIYVHNFDSILDS